MNRWALLTAPLAASLPNEGPPSLVLVPGTAIKCIRIVNGRFAFLAYTTPPHGWERYETDEDLPAFTDKGTEARANRRATLRPGKPRMGATAATRRLVCKVREDQHRHVELSAESAGLTVSEHVRRALIADGMPE